MITNTSNYVVCYGEVLWDIFPSGSRAGGAPFNVAYNLFKMGIDTKMLSRIGNDQLGLQLLNQINQWGITTDFIQVDQENATGTVLASFDQNGEAVYEIVKDAAWDYIETLPEHKELVQNSEAFVFGSLVTRNETSKKTLLKLLEYSKFRIFDVNFRPPFIDFEFIKDLLQKADLIKMNKAELRKILEFLSIDYINEDISIRHLQNYFDLNEVILTKGSKGARYFVGNTVYDFPAVHIEIADTVGSGDSFLAGFLSKRIQGESPEEIMKQATSLGAFITSKSGACPDYTYEEFRTFRENNCCKTS